MRIEPQDLLTQLHTLGSRVARTEHEFRMLAAFEEAVAKLVQKSVHMPWRPPPQLLELLAKSARPHGAPAWEALDRLWFFFAVHGLVADRLRPQLGRRIRAVEFRPTQWLAAMKADDLARRMWDSSSQPTGNTEERCLAEMLFLLSCSIGLPHLLSAISHLRREDIDWQRGVLFLARLAKSRGSRSGAPYHLNLRSRLALGRLELYYRVHQDLRSSDDPNFLPVHWRRPGAIAKLLRRWLQEHSLSSSVREHSRTARFIPLLHMPALFAAVQTGILPAGWQGEEHWTSRALRPGAKSTRCPAVSKGGADIVEEPEALVQVRFFLRRIAGQISPAERRTVAQELKALLPALGVREEPPRNEALVTEWATELLRTSRLRPNTVRTWLTGMYRDFAEHLEASVLTLSEDDLQELIQELVFSQQTANSQRTMRLRLHYFFSFLHDRYGLLTVNWRDPNFGVERASTQISLVTIDEAEQAMHLISRRWPNEVTNLQVALCLAFWCGLRRHEICALRIEDLLGGRWGSIRIQRSKTRAGRRTIPGALLTPAPIWAMMEDYRKDRLAQAGTERAPLLNTPGGGAWDPDDLGKRLAWVLQELTRHNTSAHSLRRGFATWTLLRWAAARGLACWPEVSGEWGKAAVASLSLSGVLEALGQDEVLVLHHLSRILGHSDPGVTVAHYLAVDLLQQAWQATFDPLQLQREVAEGLLQCSRTTLYQHLQPTERGWFNTQDVLKTQLHLLARTESGSLGQPVVEP